MSDEFKTLASESAHWYAKDGTPAYEVKARNGEMRPTTLRDARVMNLVPSVTLILRCAAAPGLQAYWENQLLDSALTLQVIEGELADKRKERIREDAKEHARMAREKGTELHAAIEDFIRQTAISPKWSIHCDRVWNTLGQYGINLMKGKPEHSFASPLGYGGKIDWHNDEIVCDFKTKKTVADQKRLAYDEHCWQLAAYSIGLFGAKIEGQSPTVRLINVFVGIDDQEVRIHEWSPEDSIRGWQAFKCLFDFWRITKTWNNT